jgi:hypothetical protein
LAAPTTTPVLKVGGWQECTDTTWLSSTSHAQEELDEEEWSALMGRATVSASEAVLTALKVTSLFAETFDLDVAAYRSMKAVPDAPTEEINETREEMEETRRHALESIDSTVKFMRMELAEL